MTDDQFNARLNEWLDSCRQMIDQHYQDRFPNLTPDNLCIKEGKRYYKVCNFTPGDGVKSVFAFIAKEDFQTKGMGQVKKGDIFKPATWNAPAKHARGNLLNDDKGMDCMSPYGPCYLK